MVAWRLGSGVGDVVGSVGGADEAVVEADTGEGVVGHCGSGDLERVSGRGGVEREKRERGRGKRSDVGRGEAYQKSSSRRNRVMLSTRDEKERYTL